MPWTSGLKASSKPSSWSTRSVTNLNNARTQNTHSPFSDVMVCDVAPGPQGYFGAVGAFLELLKLSDDL